MITVRMRYVYEDTDRHGNVRLYFWRKPGRKIRIRARPGTEEFARTYHELMELAESGQQSPDTKPGKAAAGTLRWLVETYAKSAEFKHQLDEQTQRVRTNILESCLAEPVRPGAGETFAAFPLARLVPKAIKVLRDRKAGLPEAANGRIKALRSLFRWAIEEDLINTNPAAEVRYVRHNSDGHHTWTVEEVAQFEARHPVGSKARLALALMVFTGVRRSDVVLLGRQHVRDGWFKFRQQKGRKRAPIEIELPILPELSDVIAASPTGDLTFLVTEFGRPFTAAGFGNWFRERCNEAGLKHCSAHGLRKTGAVLAAERGASENQLMAIFGWRKADEARRYTRAASRKTLAAGATTLLARGKSRT
ncbi:MAG: tyrosine-type recombinase/integrase [Hyphomicrobiaceae bacterium]